MVAVETGISIVELPTAEEVVELLCTGSFSALDTGEELLCVKTGSELLITIGEETLDGSVEELLVDDEDFDVELVEFGFEDEPREVPEKPDVTVLLLVLTDETADVLSLENTRVSLFEQPQNNSEQASTAPKNLSFIANTPIQEI